MQPIVFLSFLVFTVFAGLASMWSAWGSSKAVTREPGVTAISLECDFAVLPIAVSAEAPLHLLEAFPTMLNGISDMVTANPIRWPSSDAFGMAYRCEFGNRGATPVSLDAMFQIAFRELLPTSSPGVTSPGKVTASHDHGVTVPVLEVPNGKYVFYLVNRTASLVEVRLPDLATVRGPSGNVQRIRLMKSNRTPIPISLTPWHDKSETQEAGEGKRN